MMKIRNVIRMIKADGWRLHTARGSHRQFKHPFKTGRVTVAGHPGHDISLAMLNNVRKQAGWTPPLANRKSSAFVPAPWTHRTLLETRHAQR
jgi:predicted RNA binding protein YcfA (HicA-like mRNA interferase family)